MIVRRVRGLMRAVDNALPGRVMALSRSGQAVTARMLEEVREAMRRHEPPSGSASRPRAGRRSHRVGIVADAARSERRRHGNRRRRRLPIDFADRRRGARRRDDRISLR